MFTDLDIRNIAVQIERNGEETYRAAARQAEHKNVAEMLTWMADEEKRHRQWFESLELKARKKSKEQEELEAMGKGLLEEMVRGKTFSLEQESLSSAEQLSGVISQSLEFEEETVLFYEFLQAFLEDEEASKQLDLIINEEKSHAQQLENLLDSLGIDANEVHLPEDDSSR